MENLLRLKVVKVTNDINDINYSKEGDAGLDLRAAGRWVEHFRSNEIEADNYLIPPGRRVLVKTGVKVEIPSGYWGNIRERSGLALDYGLCVLGGVIDENYRDEIGVIILNTGSEVYKMKKNERVAQMIIQRYERINIEYVLFLDLTNRNAGFGSSGKV